MAKKKPWWKNSNLYHNTPFTYVSISGKKKKKGKIYEAKVITRGNCMMCGKELDKGLFFCEECERKVESMKHEELMKLVGKNVRVLFYDGQWARGKLGYADEFSEKYDFRRPNYFYIGNMSFKVSHVKKFVICEDEE